MVSWQIAHTRQCTLVSSWFIDGKFISIYCLFESISIQAERVLVTAAASPSQPGVGSGSGLSSSSLISVSDKVKQNRKILGLDDCELFALVLLLLLLC